MALVESSSNMDSVAIFAAEKRDATLVAALLQESGYDPSSLQIYNSRQLTSAQNFAVVVCHRRDGSAPADILADCAEATRLIVLSECTAESTVVGLLENGARHVFSLEESATLLQARLEAALRQHRSVARAHFTIDDMHFDYQKRKVFKAGVCIDLSPKEFEFASWIFRNVDKVVKNSDLMTSVWSLPEHMDTRRIDTAACRVRKKLGLSQEGGWLLKRIRCVGYRLTRASS